MIRNNLHFAMNETRILMWSFPRIDISRELQAKQIALALRDEVIDLEKAGINVIQVDEPAIREGVRLASI